MFNIQRYLEKFSKNLNSAEDNKKHLVEILKKHTEIDLLTSDIEIVNYTLRLKTSPGVKNKIFMYKEKILKDIADNTEIKIVDIQ